MIAPAAGGGEIAAGTLTATAAGIRTVAAFQLRRLLTGPRLAMAAVGAVFPAAVMLAANRAARGRLDGDLTVAMLYALIPEAVCMLGLLVTMCPAVADELERGTWPHLAVRPGGGGRCCWEATSPRSFGQRPWRWWPPRLHCR